MTVQIRSNPNSIPTDHEMMVYNTMAKQAVASKMYKGIGDENGVMMIMLASRELGIPCMQALNGGLNIIQGKVEISARMMSAMIRRAGHSLSVIEETDSRCVLKGIRSDNGDTETASFSIDEAKQAGIFKAGGGWTKWPKDMCFARALSRLARRLFSDVIGVGYVEGEISGEKTISMPEKHLQLEAPVLFDALEDDYLNCFEALEHPQALEYLDVVMKHFEWDRDKALQELLRSKQNLRTKFNTWVEKNAAKKGIVEENSQ